MEDEPKNKDIFRDDKGRYIQGHSGNPYANGGRPKGSVSLQQKLRDYLTAHPEEAQAVIASLIKQGKIGNMIATRELFDRVDGKVAETHKIEGELPIKLVFVPAASVLNEGKETKELPRASRGGESR